MTTPQVAVAEDLARILNDAADLIDRGWTQYASARDGPSRQDKEVSPCSCDAVSWCAMGALSRAANRFTDIEYRSAILCAARMALVRDLDKGGALSRSRGSLVERNDHREMTGPRVAASMRAAALESIAKEEEKTT